jgi:hypothetical protein
MLEHMDTVTYGAAVSALLPDRDAAERWFRLVSDQVRSSAADASWDDVRAGLREGAEAVGLGWAAEALVEYLDRAASEPVEVLRELADPDLEAECVEANQAAVAAGQHAARAGRDDAEAVPAEGASPAEIDDAAWQEYLARWQGQWDGTEESWPAFVESFVFWAPAGLKAAAQQLVDHAVGFDKVAALTPYGIPAAAAGPADTGAADTGPTDIGPVASGDPEADEVINGLLQDRPELARLGVERLQDLYAEVAAELEAAAPAHD